MRRYVVRVLPVRPLRVRSNRNIARAYFERPPCIWKRPNQKFYEYLKNIASLQRIDAIIYKTLKYCDVWNIEAPRIRESLALPMLTLETTYGQSSTSQTEARIQAFLEMLDS